MKTIKKAGILLFLLAVFGGLLPVFGAEPPLNSTDLRNSPLTVNLIIDGTSELKDTLEEVQTWVLDMIVGQFLQRGDRISIWSAGSTAQMLYSETLSGGNEKEDIKNLLKNLPTNGNSADFAGALRNAASLSRSSLC